MKETVLDKWAEKLLDVGKRNNLVNFHDTKSSAAEIIFPDSGTIFKKLMNGESLTLVAANQVQEKEEPPKEESRAIDGIPNPESGETETPEMLSESECIEKNAKNIKAKQALVYAQSGNPLEALKRISKNAATSIEETGVNTSFITFGLVHWSDDSSSKNISKSPILLLPIKVERKSGFFERKAVPTYLLKPLDDDVILNSTFNFILQKQLGVSLPEYQDEDLADYLQKVSETVSEFGWEVSDKCKIGIFSFQKISMYQDFKDNSERIMQNPNIRAMMGMNQNGKDGGKPSEKGESEGNPLTTIRCVVDADSSQMEAIEMAKSGQSFVLQGPPGTGKSQTITNMISECLASEKKVLFVSEKLAALNVVHEKLRQAELSDFCLELHSHKANKKDFIAELCRVLNKNKSTVSDSAKIEIEEKERAQAQLDLYEKELHLKRPVIEKSLYQLLCSYYKIADAENVIFIIEDIAQKDEKYLNECANLIDQFSTYIPIVGRDYKNNAWYGYSNPNYSFQEKTQIQSDLQGAIEYLSRISETKSLIQKNYGITLNDFGSIFYYLNVFDFLGNSDFITPSLLEESVFNMFFENYKKVKESLEKIDSLSKQILSEYRPEIFDNDINWQKAFTDLRTKYVSPLTRKLDKDYKNLSMQIQAKLVSVTMLKYEDALKIADNMNSYARLQKDFEMYAKRIENYVGSAYIGIQTNWAHCDEQIDIFKKFVDQKKNYANIKKSRIKSFDDEKFNEILKNYNNSLQKNSDAMNRVINSFDSAVFDFNSMEIEKISEFCNEKLKSIDSLDNWCQFNNLLLKMKNLGLTPFMDAVIMQGKDEKDFVNIFKKQFYSQLIAFIISSSQVLNSFNRISQDKAVRTFIEKDTLQFDINKAVIKETLSKKRPSLNIMGAGSEVSMLLREGEKKQKQKNIRTLLNTAGKLIQTIKPCFLMSPLSVSTYLDPENISFDVVIFDEASQIFPEDAIGAIYRGKQVIVVGDAKQMPPSNFFSASIVDDDYSDDDDEDIGDFESVLDLCSVCMPQKRLLWHYRSRFEQLIAFSNKNFYDSTLVSFPSVKSKAGGIGIDYYFADGLFNRKTHTNQKEAELVVDLIFKAAKEFPERSLGVVAFSVAQQDLIEKILSERRSNDDSAETFFANDGAEPFFIKNLETVQGDERDTIIFSIAYGPDEQGKLYHNFGPLNRDGGERRLNVAVTRAKWNVQLVSSMHFTDIDLSKTKSRGAALLREYLDYAENGRLSPVKDNFTNSFEQSESGFEDEVFEFLQSNGYSVERRIGYSDLKIDIGVKRSDSPDFFLAIESDGYTYHASKNARDRDRLREQILQRMGWRYYRVWSLDWFKNSANEKQQLLAALKGTATPETPIPQEISKPKITTEKTTPQHTSEIKTQPANSAPEITAPIKAPTENLAPQPSGEPTNSFEMEETQTTFEFPKYQTLTPQNLLMIRWQNPDFLGYIAKILETEGPIAEEVLLQQIAKPYYQQNKISSAIQNHFDTNLKKCGTKGITRKDGFLYLNSKTDYTLRIPNSEAEKREIKHIALEELAAGMLKIIEINLSIEKKGLFKKLASVCGFDRLSPAASERLEAAFELIKPKIVTDGNLSVRLRE